MTTSSRLLTTLIFASLLAACGSDPAPAATTSSAKPETMIGKAAGKAIAEAREKLATENLKLRQEDGTHNGEITPLGDLLIDGKAVTIDDKQRALLLEYRKSVHAIAEVGMDIGTQGADLAGKALKEAFGSIFSGDTEGVEKRMEAEAKKMETAAAKLCDLLPNMLDAQNAAAASLPQFKPYAGLTQKDVDECRTQDGRVNDEVIGKAIENAFDKKVHVDIDTSGSDRKNAAEEAEAASAEATTSK